MLTEAIGPRSRKLDGDRRSEKGQRYAGPRDGRHHDPELCKAPAEGRSASDLLHEADLKMYEDKIRTKEEQKAKEKQEKK